MINQLLNLADELEKPDDPIKNRKAISIAYYATFHALCEMIADTLVEDKSSSLYEKLYRHIDHKIFENDKAFEIEKTDPDVFKEIKTSLQNLKQERETADYQSANKKTIFDAKVPISSAQNTIALIRELDQEQRRILALNILIGGGRLNTRTKHQKNTNI